MVLVDSSVWIEALRRRGNILVKLALENLLENYDAQLCDPVRLEVMGGCRAEERGPMGHYFSVIPFRQLTALDWENALKFTWILREKGITLPWMDVLILSVAIADGHRLYSLDKHFEEAGKHLPLRLYQPGYNGTYQPDID